jgi:hypothetical protein
MGHVPMNDPVQTLIDDMVTDLAQLADLEARALIDAAFEADIK